MSHHSNGEHRGGSRLRLAWVEEWMSALAQEVLPYLAQRHEVTYVTAGEKIPDADFVRVIREKRGRHMNVAGFALSRDVNRLYRDGLIDLALVWASIGFALRGVPFINLVGGSVLAEIRLAVAALPWYRRAGFLTGLVHFALPEMLCNLRAARVIVPSSSLKSDLLRLHGLSDHQVLVVPHGTELTLTALYDRKPAALAPKILFVGRLHRGKGIAAVLEEFIRRREIAAEFFILGDGPDRERMQNAAAEDRRVKLLGHVGKTDLKWALAATDIFAFPSFYEGFGLSLLEAMASGHACVCYDIPAAREVLGDAGVRVRTGDAAALVDEIARLVKTPDRVAAYSAQAHRRARQFSWDHARRAIDGIIRATAAGLGARRLVAPTQPPRYTGKSFSMPESGPFPR
jgi:glycosyltransferase involved in cell wall biosynthesis